MGHGEEVRCMQKLVGRLFITFNILFCVSNSVIAYYSSFIGWLWQYLPHIFKTVLISVPLLQYHRSQCLCSDYNVKCLRIRELSPGGSPSITLSTKPTYMYRCVVWLSVTKPMWRQKIVKSLSLQKPIAITAVCCLMAWWEHQKPKE